MAIFVIASKKNHWPWPLKSKIFFFLSLLLPSVNTFYELMLIISIWAVLMENTAMILKSAIDIIYHSLFKAVVYSFLLSLTKCSTQLILTQDPLK